MNKAIGLGVVGLLLVGACSGGDGGAPEAITSSATEQRGESIVIRTSLAIADTPGAEPIATGKVVAGSTLAGSPFCLGGTLRDTHAGNDSEVEPTGHLIARTITCPEGTVKVGFTPQTGSWTIVSGTGSLAGLHGTGDMKVRNPADEDALGSEILTGTVQR